MMQALFGQQLHFAPQLFSRNDLSTATKMRQTCLRLRLCEPGCCCS